MELGFLVATLCGVVRRRFHFALQLHLAVPASQKHSGSVSRALFERMKVLRTGFLDRNRVRGTSRAIRRHFRSSPLCAQGARAPSCAALPPAVHGGGGQLPRGSCWPGL